VARPRPNPVNMRALYQLAGESRYGPPSHHGLGLASKVERSTTRADRVDEMETGWMQPHVGKAVWTGETKPSPSQGEGRGCESLLLPVQNTVQSGALRPVEAVPSALKRASSFGVGEVVQTAFCIAQDLYGRHFNSLLKRFHGSVLPAGGDVLIRNDAESCVDRIGLSAVKWIPPPCQGDGRGPATKVNARNAITSSTVVLAKPNHVHHLLDLLLDG
jgi:hypothetical protein